MPGRNDQSDPLHGWTIPSASPFGGAPSPADLASNPEWRDLLRQPGTPDAACHTGGEDCRSTTQPAPHGFPAASTDQAARPAESADCPSCRRPMISVSLLSSSGRNIPVDLCDPCALFWFDNLESPAISGSGTIELYRRIVSTPRGTNPVRTSLSCPKCSAELELTRDRSRGGPFVYHKCPRCRGRAISYTHFLVEKAFIRQLAPAEIAALAATVTSIRCDGCGSALSLAANAACPRCKTPISILDRDAASKALADFSSRPAPDPTLHGLSSAASPAQLTADQRAEAILAAERVRSRSELDRRSAASRSSGSFDISFDISDDDNAPGIFDAAHAIWRILSN